MKNLTILFMVAACLFFFISPGKAQGIFDTIKDKAKEKAEQETEEALEDAVEGDEEEPVTEEQTEEPVEEEQVKTTEGEVTTPPKEEFKTYSKYDFIPGEKIIYYDDFSTDNEGDFPPNWYTNKSGEVVTTNLYTGKWFQFAAGGSYYMDKLLPLPDNFTLEFDMIPLLDEGDGGASGFDFTLLRASEEDPYPGAGLPGEGGVSIQLYTSGHYIQGYSDHQYGPASGYDKASGLLVMKESNHVSIWVQKTRVRVYLHGQKVFDIPKAFSPGMLLNQFRIMPDHASAPMITNMRFAEAGADMRSKLITEGKLVTRGILFDVNSDKIKPESYGVLKEISKALSENPDVKVRIIGHTDSDGTDEANLDLSKRRAASVKNALNSEFGIDLSRMETDGKGESEPFDQNNNPEGKANNRRVEFIKL